MFESILSELNGSSRNILASSVLSADGLPVATLPPQAFDEDTVGGLSAALMHCGRLTAMEMLGGGLDWVCVKGGEGSLLISVVGAKILLVAWMRPNADALSIFPDFERAAESLRDISLTDIGSYISGDQRAVG